MQHVEFPEWRVWPGWWGVPQDGMEQIPARELERTMKVQRIMRSMFSAGP